jgi:hypothetical protein
MSRFLAGLTVLAALACPSCTRHDSASVAPADRATGADAARPSETRAARTLARDGAPVLGHLLIPSATGLLADLRMHVAPANLAAKLRPEAIAEGVVRRLGLDPRVAAQFDLQRPLGCVVGDLGRHPGDFACTFGYAGGAAGFVRDVGASTDADGHAGALLTGQTALYLDALGRDVVISGTRDFFPRTQAYLAGNVVARAPEVSAGVEVVVFTRDVFGRYGAALEAWASSPDARKQERLQQMLASAPASVRRAFELLDLAKREFDGLNVRELAEHEQASFTLSVGDPGASLAWQFVPVAGGRFPGASLSRGRKLDAGFVEALPDGALALVAQNLELRAARAWNMYSAGGATEAEVQQRVRATADALSALRGAPVSPESVGREVAEDVALYDGHIAHLLLEQPGSPLGLGMLSTYRLVPGADARAAWLAWTRRFSAESVLGATLSKLVPWTFTPAAYSIDGVPVDRWTIRLSRLLGREAADDLGGVAPLLVTEGLNIDRLETAGQVHFAIAPGAEEPLLRRALAARDGRASLHDDAALSAVLRRASGANVVMAFDFARSVDWFERLLVHFNLLEAGTLPRSYGRGLDDVYMHFSEPEAGLVGGELVVGHGILSGLRRSAP